MLKGVIVALDFENKEKTLNFLDKFDKEIFVKVGMELFYAEGPEIVREIKKRGHKIFLDLKLHDIPHTVYKAVKSLLKLDVDMIDVHIAGGSEMISEARRALNEEKKDIILLGITMLTSSNEKILKDDIRIDPNLSLTDTVISYAKTGKDSGLTGVVSSALEVESIKKELGSDFVTVTPGIRLAKIENDDQKRVVTPEDARKMGSDFIVVGRPITQAQDPVSAYEEIEKSFLGE